MIGAAERLAEPRRGICADSHEPVSKASLVQVPHPVQALADSDGYRCRLRLTGQFGEFPDELMSFGVLDVEAHDLPFYPALLPGYLGRASQPVTRPGWPQVVSADPQNTLTSATRS